MTFFISSCCSLDFIPNESKNWENIVESLQPENLSNDYYKTLTPENEKVFFEHAIKKDASIYFLENNEKEFRVHEFPEKKQGDETENNFLQICKTKGIFHIKSSKKQDYYDHFDFILFFSEDDQKTKKGVFVDIKGKKSLRRNGIKQTKYFFVELHKEGWIYNSKADYIAIDISHVLNNSKNKINFKFLFYEKNKLIQYMKKNICIDLPIVSWPEQSLLRVYIRKYKRKGYDGTEKTCATVLSLLPTQESFKEAGTLVFCME